ncbi:MAG: glutathione-disulfide reductase [Proteobacteria bacterium]|nr:glutathione-disulfide reductase [Pseudomonadota bacterium]
MMQYDYDLFVIGAGSGGVRAARLAAKSGARVAIAEDDRIGGTCVIRGCVPKKLLVYGSEFSQHFRDAAAFGWTLDAPRFDWATLRDNVQNEVSRLSGLYRTNLEAAGAAIIEDRAEVVDAHTVRMKKSGKTCSAERILIATGGHTTIPRDLKGHELGISSTHAFHLEKLPKSIVIAGGGYIAIEFATIFSGLGVDTTIVYRSEQILRGFDTEIRAHVQSELQRTGVKIVTGAVFTEIDKLADGRKLAFLTNNMRLEVDQVMFAIGRDPNTRGLGLENAGVKLNERGAVIVDEYSRSNVSSIWAVGDVTDRINLTPVAIREAQAFAWTEFMNKPTAFDHADVASAVFGRPPVGAVGLTEDDARAKLGRIKVFRSQFRPMRNILAGNEQRTLMKLIVDAASDRVVGVHIAGPEAPELVQVAAIAVKAKLTKAQWDATCAVHPTAAEELVLMGEPVAHDNEAPA